MIESSSNAVALKNYIAFFHVFDLILYQIFKGNLVTCIFSAYKIKLNSFISVRFFLFMIIIFLSFLYIISLVILINVQVRKWLEKMRKKRERFQFTIKPSGLTENRRVELQHKITQYREENPVIFSNQNHIFLYQ